MQVVESNSKFTIEYIFLLEGVVISWGSKKQTCITHPTMETDFVVLAAACKQAKWLINLLIDVPLWTKPFSVVTIYCNNESTLRVATSKTYNNKSRHSSLRHNYVRELLDDGVITVEICKSIPKLCGSANKGHCKGNDLQNI
jgi:hypothetical protein